MRGKRYDGRRVRNMEPFTRIIPYIMKTRMDSQNLFNEEFLCEPLDAYIKKQPDGSEITYMKIIITAMVRLIALRPALNRFVMNGKIYTRNKIWVSFVVHRNLRGDTAETTVKLCFDGTENLSEISAAIDKIIGKNARKGASNNTDKLAGLIMSIPGPLIRFAIWGLTFLDKHEMMPKSVLDASPFHTSFFITNLKSLGINYIYHHVYEFGTTGLFLALGKEKNRAVPLDDGTIAAKKVLTLGFVSDERFCDGLYFARSMRLFKKYMTNPELLEEKLKKKFEDVK